jgi:hypothetical protein
MKLPLLAAPAVRKPPAHLAGGPARGTRSSAVWSRFLHRAGMKLSVLVLAAGTLAVIGVQSAQAADLYHPEPTSMSPGSVCVGSVLSFAGHEFMGTMTAEFTPTNSGPSQSATVYNIVIPVVPVEDNDTAQTTVPYNLPSGTYTVSLNDVYGDGTAPGTLTVHACPAPGPGHWNLGPHSSAIAFKPVLRDVHPFKPATGSGTVQLIDPNDMLVIDTSAKAELKMALPSNSCAALLGSGSKTSATTLTITWQPDSISPSTVTFTGFSVTKSHEGIILNFGGHGTRAKGSYAGPDAGASSTMTLTPKLTRAQLAKTCAAKSGLASLTLSAGSLSLQ